MTDKRINRKSQLWMSEENIKNKVYSAFELERVKAKQTVDTNASYVASGQYEDQAAFMSYSAFSTSQQEWHEVEGLIGRLYSKPYFSHISALLNGSTEEYFLSDNEYLEKLMLIGDNGFLLPFKQDPDRPFLSQIFHCYQARNGEEFTDKTGDTIKPTLICDDEINNGELINVTLIYSDHAETQEIIDSDELLAKKLEENRGNPSLTNIISTLQLNQFEIIQDDVSSDFAVQGCAGSGKSQILLHRLFFLRDMLSESNWERVLLITPTELFRSYSSELVRRYSLSSIKNTSIAELYKSFLEAYDPNFKHRQYRFELTEEYLPDDYLHEIYDDDCIYRIDNEIKKAIKKYIDDACTLLGCDMEETFTTEYIKELTEKLDEKIEELDKLEIDENKGLNNVDAENARNELLSEINELVQSVKKMQTQYDNALIQKKKYDEAYKNFSEIKRERSEWLVQRNMKISNINQGLADIEVIEPSELSFDIPAQYSKLLYQLDDLTRGDTYKHDEEYLEFLNEYYNQSNAELLQVCEGKSPELYKRIINDKLHLLANEIDEKQKTINELNAEIDSFDLNQKNLENRQNQDEDERRNLRSKYVRARFFLQRIETTVFEKEVWKTLAPIKDRYNIKTIEKGPNNKRIRILYKSDLLFYLRIYSQLHSSNALPDYKLLCIDEGQDLHAVEYATLRALYPNATFNIFGDTSQVLHANCGVKKWSEDTLVKKVYALNKNYRNTAAIVSFCNNKFGASMDYLGDPASDLAPSIVKTKYELEEVVNNIAVTIIVKNQKMFANFCEELGLPETAFEFLDTNAIEESTSKIKCYTIFAAKGLEFSKALVYSKEMTKNQKIVACTRAMESLYYYE